MGNSVRVQVPPPAPFFFFNQSLAVLIKDSSAFLVFIFNAGIFKCRTPDSRQIEGEHENNISRGG